MARNHKNGCFVVETSGVSGRNLFSGIQKIQGVLKILSKYVVLLTWIRLLLCCQGCNGKFSPSVTCQSVKISELGYCLGVRFGIPHPKSHTGYLSGWRQRGIFWGDVRKKQLAVCECCWAGQVTFKGLLVCRAAVCVSWLFELRVGAGRRFPWHSAAWVVGFCST